MPVQGSSGALRGRSRGRVESGQVIRGRFSAQSRSRRGFFSSQIIAILAAILFPVFARAREKARQSSCLSNTKQIGLGLVAYVQDYDERLPGCYIGAWTGGFWSPTNPRGNLRWFQAIEPYIKNSQVWLCPSSTSAMGALDYGCNRSVCTEGTAANKLARFDVPADTIVISERPGTSGASQHPYHCAAYGQYGCCHVQDPHNSGGNYVFLDGHCKWMKSESTKGMWLCTGHGW